MVKYGLDQCTFGLLEYFLDHFLGPVLRKGLVTNFPLSVGEGWVVIITIL